MYDPFIKLTHFYTEGGKVLTSPLFILPEAVHDICEGEVHLSGRTWDVREGAIEIHRLVVEKIHENKQSETMGKS